MRRLVYAVLMFVCACASYRASTGMAFVNGVWFDGTKFEPATWYTADGIFTRTRPAKIIRTVDLAGAFVVPAYGEAHNHNISRPPRPSELNPYVTQGVLYMMNLNNIVEGPDIDRSAQPVDVLYANGGLTGAGGHVVQLHENILARGGLKGFTKETLDGTAFHVIESDADLLDKWPLILAAKPDLIKAYLGFSEEYEKRRSDPAYFGKRGLNPALLASIVALAHAKHLRVAVHIETAHDFDVAVSSGADFVAHLPGAGTAGAESEADVARWLITDAGAEEARRHGTMAITTISNVVTKSGPTAEVMRDIMRRNIALLRQHHVPLLIGSDLYGGTSLAEALLLGQGGHAGNAESIGALDNLEVLRLLCVETPRALFPGRRIGAIAEGYEATFLALSQNPLSDINALRSIKIRYKRGVELTP
jgi:hypothetical protein